MPFWQAYESIGLTPNRIRQHKPLYKVKSERLTKNLLGEWAYGMGL